MAGMRRDQEPLETAAINAAASELSRRGWQPVPVPRETSGVDLYAERSDTGQRVAVRVLGNPRFDRRGRPEWHAGSWRFQSRPRTDAGQPYFRHPYYPGFWVLRDFPTQSQVHLFLHPQEDPGARPRFFICPTETLRQLLSETPTWAENYHGVRDRPCWVGLDTITVFEERWDHMDQMGQ